MTPELPIPDLPIPDLPIFDLVARFYGKVRQDALLAPVFMAAISDTDAAWAAYLGRPADFWSSVTQTGGRYHGDPFSAHFRLPDLTPDMFDRWLDLFHLTCREVLPPDQAMTFGDRADRIARSLRMGLFERLPTRKALCPASGPPVG